MSCGKKIVSQNEVSGATALEEIHVESPHEELSEETGSNNAANLMIFNLLDARWGRVWPERLG